MEETDKTIQSNIRNLLNVSPSQNDKRIVITFEYKGKQYKTTFLLTKTFEADYTKLNKEPISGNYTEQIHFRNKCISIEFTSKRTEIPSLNKSNTKWGRMNDFFTELEKNDDDRLCFTPRLKTEESIKTIDVLVVLKTKLALLFPTEIQITLIDAMTVDGIEISVNRIMRGGDAYYEKYGYSSILLNPVKEWIQTLKWKDIGKDLQDLITTKFPLHNVNSNSPTKFTDVMKQIPNKIFNNYNDIPYINLFEKVYTLFTSINRLPIELYRGIFIFTLDTANSRWIEWEKMLLFTDMKEQNNSVGGSRRRKTRSKTRSKKSKKLR